VILLAAAVEAELGFWRRRRGVDTLAMGIGPVEAATALATELARREYGLVVNVGLAGAFGGAARIGDGVVVIDDVMEIDLETGAPIALPPGEMIVAKANSDPELAGQLHGKGFASLRGVTVARVTSSEETAKRLARDLDAQVESMEGFAALRAAARAGVRAIELRGISNRCGDRASSGWDFSAGVAGLSRIVNAFFELPSVEEMSR
jgi:futalosine hydrolase